MFDKLIKKITDFARTRPGFDPASLNDPIALQTAWHPARGGGTNFRTRKLVSLNSTCMAFRPTLQVLLFAAVFIGIPILMLGVLYYRHPFNFFHPKTGMLLAMAFLAIFMLAGLIMLFFSTRPIVFDRSRDLFRKSWKNPPTPLSQAAGKGFARLSQIHALQIVSEHCSGDDSSFMSYELNLVLKDASRINVVDHGKLEKLQADAAQLARFLGKPLWDAS